MEEFYRLNNSVISSYTNGVVAGEAIASTSCGGIHGALMVDDDMLQLEAEATTALNMSDMIKSQIVNHPLYPKLVSAYIECQKVCKFFFNSCFWMFLAEFEVVMFLNCDVLCLK